MAWAVKRASAVITVSQHSRSDIVRMLGIPQDRVHVTYEAVDERFHPGDDPTELATLRAKYGLPDTFVLYTGGAEKRKNLSTLIRAWSLLRESVSEKEVHLVIVADFPPPDRLYPDVPRLARDLGVAPSVTFIRQVDEEDKPALYRSALVFCFPSMYEGFGFTPLEAMASGVPVLASEAASIPEVVGNAGWLLPPEDVRRWAEAIRDIIGSGQKRAELRARGLERARSFSWRRTARETVDVYRKVLGV
jgi:glycosyltransferase involved in cell wall biosynthesis